MDRAHNGVIVRTEVMTSPSYACRNTAFDMPDLTDQSPSYVLTHPLSLSVHLCTVYVGGCARADTPRITYTFEGLEDLRDWRAESRRKERKHERTNELLISPVSCSLIYGFKGFEGRVPEEGRNERIAHLLSLARSYGWF